MKTGLPVLALLAAFTLFTLTTTPAHAGPAVATGNAFGVLGSTATLKATVNPDNLATGAWFEWGTNTSYGHTTAITNLPATDASLAVSAALTGLTPGRTYHYRVVATNSAGASMGGDLAFRTLYAEGTVIWQLNGTNPLTNECYTAFTDPGATAGVSLVALAGGSLAGGYYHSLALKADSTVVAWGDNSVGEINVPATATNVVAIAGGFYHSLALKADGTVVAWEYNDDGETTVPANATNVVAIAAGAWHSLALQADGTVVAWGNNSYGQTDVPATATNIVAIAGGGNYSLALKADGTVVAWGYNGLGQTAVPATATNIVAIAGGWGHSLALKADGTVVAWGYNGSGQTAVPALATNVVAIAAGGYHSLALKADGTVVGWGLNGSGQTSVPATATNVVAIAAGGYHSLALKADGTVVAWGWNEYGQTTVPASVNALIVPIGVSGTVDANTPGSYTLTYTATNLQGVVSSTNRTVVVRDTIPPVLTLLGDHSLVWPLGTAWSDPGATATDVSPGDLTASITVSGSVNVSVPGDYLLTYSVSDASGNTSTTNRTVVVVSAPTISGLAAACTTTNAVTGIRNAAFAATVTPNGLATTAWFEYGLTTACSDRSAATNLAAAFTGTNLTFTVGGFMQGTTYHWRVVATNALGTTIADQSLSVPALYPPGDLNGDGVVSAGELNAVLSNYWSTSPWLQMTNVAGLGQTNVTFALTNDLAGAFTVEYSTNLTDWLPLGPATPRYGFTDTNTPATPQHFYRLRTP